MIIEAPNSPPPVETSITHLLPGYRCLEDAVLCRHGGMIRLLSREWCELAYPPGTPPEILTAAEFALGAPRRAKGASSFRFPLDKLPLAVLVACPLPANEE